MDFGLAGPGMQPQDQQQQPQPSLLDMLNSSGGNAASLIAPPPEGWQSQAAAYDQAGLGNGWIANTAGGAGFGGTGHDWFENPAAMAHTQRNPMPHGINPFTDIVYGGGSGQEGQGSGFYLKDPSARFQQGADLFGGRKFQQGNLPKDIPTELQPWLAPALMRYFYQNNYVGQGGSGMNAPWTARYAPEVGKPEHPTWPGTAKYDPWHRDLGPYQNLYS